ncbi:hypothetical protein KP509_01G036500 [Ceratopteris richardii]|uniref:Uncharacterized protein n=1 Tax=Ceratopteris richardii TaxID=49495 RepID=A0A8T2VFR9_CERRI|nr:hypothetical protein KP509_01G036500 [Ceratopteris richardii]
MSAERKMISLTSGAALTFALLLLTTGSVFGTRSLPDTQQELGDERNNVQETVDVVNNPRGSTGIQNGDEERNVLPGQLNLAPRIPIPPSVPSFTDLSDYIPAAKTSFHSNMPHRRSPVPPSGPSSDEFPDYPPAPIHPQRTPLSMEEVHNGAEFSFTDTAEFSTSIRPRNVRVPPSGPSHGASDDPSPGFVDHRRHHPPIISN